MSEIMLHPACRDLGVLPSTLDEGAAARAAIGLLVLATDQTMEHEFRSLVQLAGVGLYVARLYNDATITPETLRAIAPRIAPATALLLPGLRLDVVAFGCTSATMTLGKAAVFAEIHKARPDVQCTTPATAAFAAFRALGARRIGVLTPYSPAVNRTVRAYLEAHGVEVAAFATFDKPDDREAARIDLRSIRQGIEALCQAAALDAVFVSCTSLRLARIAAEIEAAIGVAVTSSDHALAWHALRLAGIRETIPGVGRLFTL
ncbi:MAG: maleate cis-trans isomerase family protein [Acetobacteraceae bacterium]